MLSLVRKYDSETRPYAASLVRKYDGMSVFILFVRLIFVAESVVSVRGPKHPPRYVSVVT